MMGFDPASLAAIFSTAATAAPTAAATAATTAGTAIADGTLATNAFTSGLATLGADGSIALSDAAVPASLAVGAGAGAAASGGGTAAGGASSSLLSKVAAAGTLASGAAALGSLVSPPKPPALPGQLLPPSLASGLSGGRNPSLAAQSIAEGAGGTRTTLLGAPSGSGKKLTGQ